MKTTDRLNVMYYGRKVGTMALYKGHLAAFEYDREWIAEGFSISPFYLPLEQKVFIPKADPFDGLFGVFADSLPDGWGRLLVDRMLRREGIDPDRVDALNRLAIVGQSGMGALCYEPEHSFEAEEKPINLDAIAEECRRILNTESVENLDELFRLGGSSGGARPKILTKIDGEEWIIKFPSSTDKTDIGKQEYEYSLCARECGIQMTETRLFPSKNCAGYFGTKRFDRRRKQDGREERVHMLSASAVLETSHRIPNLDYDILMKLTLELTKDFSEVEKLYKLMCFNVFAHNRDDHSKNFTYLYEEKEEKWVLSPAYDLTFSHSIGGEHATTIHGNGKNPDMLDCVAVADAIGMDSRKAKRIAKEVKECVNSRLRKYINRESR